MLSKLQRFRAASPKKRRKFAAVAAPTSSTAKSLTVASVRATSATFAGSLRFPRKGCGERYGESVSISSDESGKTLEISRKFCDFGYVTLPANDTRKPISIPCFASASVPEKQCRIPPRPVPRHASSRIARHSGHASRQWMIIGSFAACAIASCSRKTTLLYFARRQIVVEIQSNLAERDNARMLARAFPTPPNARA